MYKNLRILFCILAATCAAVTIFIFVYFDFWGFVPLAAGVVFALLMIIFKRMQEDDEKRKNPLPPSGDFITGKAPHEDNPEEK